MIQFYIMKELSIFNKNTELQHILKRFDKEHDSIFYNICCDLNFNVGNFIINILPRYIKSKKYPFSDMCNLIQKLFLMMGGYKDPSKLFSNISKDSIEVVSYVSDCVLKESEDSDIKCDGINWDYDYKDCIQNIKALSNCDDILVSYIEEQDYIKEVDGIRQIVLVIPLNECIIINAYYWNILVRNSKIFFEEFNTNIDKLDCSEFLENLITGLDLVDTRDIVVLTDCIKKEWIRR